MDGFTFAAVMLLGTFALIGWLAWLAYKAGGETK
jgi:hypothetical protein